MNRGGGFFFGGGRGAGGRGWRNCFWTTGLTGWQRAGLWPGSWPGYAGPTREQEAAALKGLGERLEGALDSIRKRIEELETKAKTE